MNEFDKWKWELCRIANMLRTIYLLPCDNVLYQMWESGSTPDEAFELIKKEVKS